MSCWNNCYNPCYSSCYNPCYSPCYSPCYNPCYNPCNPCCNITIKGGDTSSISETLLITPIGSGCSGCSGWSGRLRVRSGSTTISGSINYKGYGPCPSSVSLQFKIGSDTTVKTLTLNGTTTIDITIGAYDIEGEISRDNGSNNCKTYTLDINNIS